MKKPIKTIAVGVCCPACKGSGEEFGYDDDGRSVGLIICYDCMGSGIIYEEISFDDFIETIKLKLKEN